jgi:hypothetical protein
MILGLDEHGRDVNMDVKRLVTTRLLVQANSGAGKSYTLRRILEQTYGHVQQIVIDPEDEFYTLREKFDYVLAGRQGGDCPADVRSSELLARRILELGTSAIVGIYELKAHDRIRFVKLFLESMMSAPRSLWHPVLVVIDEAAMFAPEKGYGEAESLSAVVDIMTRGRKRGFCGVLAAQRISHLHKSACDCNNKLIGRTALDIDNARACRELGFRSREREFELRTLKDGQFFAFGPAISDAVIKIKVGEVQTTHPKSGERSAPPTPPREKVKAILAKLADLPQEVEQKAQTEADLKKEVQRLEQELRQAHKAQPQSDPAAIEKAREAGAIAIRKELAKSVGKLHVDYRKILERVIVTVGEMSSKSGSLHRELCEIELPTIPDLDKIVREVSSAPAAIHIAREGVYESRGGGFQKISTPLSSGNGNEKISSTEQSILDAIAELEVLGVDRAPRVQVGFRAGYTNLLSKGFKNASGSLRSAGLIDYPDSDTVTLTESGRSAAHYPDVPGSEREHQERIMSMLGGAHEKIIRELISAYPHSINRVRLGELAGYSNVLSKGFKNAIGRLRTLGFVEYPDTSTARASALLFLKK